MLTDIKTWLETTGLEVAEVFFQKPPPLPYIVINSDDSTRGADSKNGISSRDINIELYSNKIDKETEKKIEDLLNEKSIAYTKNRTWIPTYFFIETTYDFNLTEKL